MWKGSTVADVPLMDSATEARAPTLFEKAQVHSLFRLADVVVTRLVGSPVPQQAGATPAAAAVPPQPQVQAAQHARKIEVSDVLDPMEVGLADPLTPGVLNAFVGNYRELKHGYPQGEVEPTLEQVSAVNARVVTLQLAPYADFSTPTLFGCGMAKVLKHRAWLPNRGCTRRTVEVPGSDSCNVWHSYWRVSACCRPMRGWPAAFVSSTVVVALTAPTCCQEASRQLAFEYAE